MHSSPKRLEQILARLLDRREERAKRRTVHIAELRKRGAEADARLKRLYDAIENGIADVSDPVLKERVTELKAIRDQARADAERAAGALDRLGPSITPQALKTFAAGMGRAIPITLMARSGWRNWSPEVRKPPRLRNSRRACANPAN